MIKIFTILCIASLFLTSCDPKVLNPEDKKQGTEEKKPDPTDPTDPTNPVEPATPTINLITEGMADLGLSVKWAACNVGATKPEEFGWYFQWAETEYVTGSGHADEFTPEKYKYYNSEGKYYTKYNSSEEQTILPEDDAAAVHWGSGWRTPTKAEVEELRDNTKWENAEMNGVKGRKLTSKVEGYTDKWIFVPFSGYYYYGTSGIAKFDPEEFVSWTSTIYPKKDDSTNKYWGKGHTFQVSSTSVNANYYTSRFSGCTVRAVKAKN